MGREDILARHIPPGHWDASASTFNPVIAARAIWNYIDSLKMLEKNSLPASKMKTTETNWVFLQVFPSTINEKLLLPGFRAEVHLAKGKKLNNLNDYQAAAYKNSDYSGALSLILGAGNSSALSFTDILHKFFVEKKVVILKVHPVLDYLGKLFTKIFEPFIKAGYLRIAMGGAKVGAYLTHHPDIDEIYMTGSDKTFEAIVYGVGEECKKIKHWIYA